MVDDARLKLVVLSFLTLLVELALIRFTAANDVHLAYLTNFVLLASFLGIGLGFLRADRGPDLFRWAPVALAVLVAFVLAFPVSESGFGRAFHLRGGAGGPPLPRGVDLSIVFLLVVAVMTALGHGVARAFVRFRPLEAYRLDILGSIAGIATFSALSFLRLPPIGWGAMVALAFGVLLRHRVRWWQAAAIAAVLTMLTVESLAPNDRWSPYYRVTVVRTPAAGITSIWTNGIPHQTAYPVRTLRRIERFYFFPYRHLGPGRPRSVLVVGAGTGNDVAVALAEGARHVDAVEIDPVIQDLGRLHHADRPYQDPRVTVHIDDGRAFLHRTSARYDLVLFALPDSLTLIAGQSNLRLENYLFTIESMREVRRHLRPGGTFSMYNYYGPSLLNRYAGTLATVYGARPCVELGDPLGGGRQAVLTAGAGASRACRAHWTGHRVEAPTDDHPFPYLRKRSISPFYLQALGLVLLASLVLIRSVGASFRGMARYLDLAFMGGAFLLLETKNVVQFALLFGTTWFVNSLVFTGVLLSVLAAIEVARRVNLPRPALLYVALFAALSVAWVVPPATLLGLPPVARFAAAIAIAFTPIFLANLVFAQRFRDTASSGMAFGANLLGAMVGGALEYLALVTGYRFLLVVLAALYALAFLVGTRRLVRVV